MIISATSSMKQPATKKIPMMTSRNAIGEVIVSTIQPLMMAGSRWVVMNHVRSWDAEMMNVIPAELVRLLVKESSSSFTEEVRYTNSSISTTYTMEMAADSVGVARPP